MSTDSEKSARGDQVKVVLRRLPKYMTESEVLEQISPLPAEVIETFFRPANFAFDRAAYATLTLVFSEYCDSLMDFERRFDGYIFVDSRGNDSTAVVEAAVNQHFSKCDRARMKQDTRVGALDTDKYYLDFCKKLEDEKAIPIMTLEQQIRKLNQPEDARAQIGRLETPLVKYFLEKEGGKKTDLRRKMREKKPEKKKNIMEILMKPSSASAPSTSGTPTPSPKPSKAPKDSVIEKEKAEKKREKNALRKQKFMDERRKQKEELEQENPKPPRAPTRENRRKERPPKPPRPTPAKTLGEQQGEDWIKKLTDPKAAPIKKKHDVILIDCVQKSGSAREDLTRPTRPTPKTPKIPSNSSKPSKTAAKKK
ncbi:CBN-SMG-4 protein [Caenorhabditis brenneri]|uniref:CBN-SMG-4 protein n=1 Tax=Caenorhabditis brenneri TaxID=135651 RepID=G0NPM3_CAEBE|nr:CBN-SMG-4 protein [Caenorhabditis brenneri]